MLAAKTSDIRVTKIVGQQDEDVGHRACYRYSRRLRESGCHKAQPNERCACLENIPLAHEIVRRSDA